MINTDYCIRMGWIRPPEPPPAKAAKPPSTKSRYQTEEYKAKKAARRKELRRQRIAAGLTGEGKPRIRRIYAKRQPRNHLSRVELRARYTEYNRRYEERIKRGEA